MDPKFNSDMEYHWIFKDSWPEVEFESEFFVRHGGWKLHTTDKRSNSMLMERPIVKFFRFNEEQDTIYTNDGRLVPEFIRSKVEIV